MTHSPPYDIIIYILEIWNNYTVYGTLLFHLTSHLLIKQEMITIIKVKRCESPKSKVTPFHKMGVCYGITTIKKKLIRHTFKIYIKSATFDLGVWLKCNIWFVGSHFSVLIKCYFLLDFNKRVSNEEANSNKQTDFDLLHNCKPFNNRNYYNWQVDGPVK